MNLTFYKFHGTGNDFIMVDNRDNNFSKNDTNLINLLCHRRFGIGADGLILLEKPEVEGDDFKMVYYNSDGNQSSMCGNGGRCLVAFAKYLKIIVKKAKFTAIDGPHEALIKDKIISLKMQNVEAKNLNENFLFLNTGSPHHIIFTEEVDEVDVKAEGAKIRYSSSYESSGGTNVNFVQPAGEDAFFVRTYERGVEDETYSCGTGVTAVALAVHATGKATSNRIKLKTPGGDLEVKFTKEDETFTNVWLTGPAEFVFKGEIIC